MTPQTIPGVLRIAHPKERTAPLAFDSPHSGALYPADFGYAAAFADLRRAEDAFVDQLYVDAPAAGAPFLAADFPRSYIDVNRALREIDPDLIDGDWPDPVDESPKSALGVGLMWRICNGDKRIYDRKLSVAEAQARIETYWKPYHGALRELLAETYERFGAVWHVNCHSMPTLSNAASSEGPGVRRPEICLGDRHGTACAPGFTQAARKSLENAGFQVATNEPYAGAELICAYSNPKERRHSLQIEIRRDLYMNEETGERNANFNRARDAFRRLALDLAAFSLASL